MDEKSKEDLAIFVSDITNRVIRSRFADIGGEGLSTPISPTAQSMKPNGGKNCIYWRGLVQTTTLSV
jgi:hypothetical protein